MENQKTFVKNVIMIFKTKNKMKKQNPRYIKGKTREEYEAEKAEKNKEKEEQIKAIKAHMKEVKKANECPECHETQLKKFERRNYPFGKKSKPVVTRGKKCIKCGYSITKNKKRNEK